MRRTFANLATIAALLYVTATGASGQERPAAEIEGDEISAISFDTAVGLTATGVIESSSGFRFPDGTTQSTASISIIGTTANSGLYGNTIADITPPLPFTEICFTQGQVLSDIHVIPKSTAGGNCVPGDVGWIIEQDRRPAATWDSAKVDCLLDGMRLPEVFEWLYSCNNAVLFGLSMEGEWEWSSNSSVPRDDGGSTTGAAVNTVGNPTCTNGGWRWVTRQDGLSDSHQYRCVR